MRLAGKSWLANPALGTDLPCNLMFDFGNLKFFIRFGNQGTLKNIFVIKKLSLNQTLYSRMIELCVLFNYSVSLADKDLDFESFESLGAFVLVDLSISFELLEIDLALMIDMTFQLCILSASLFLIS